MLVRQRLFEVKSWLLCNLSFGSDARRLSVRLLIWRLDTLQRLRVVGERLNLLRVMDGSGARIVDQKHVL